jgi:hypothetical protein
MPPLTLWFWIWEKKKTIHPSSLEDRSSKPPMRSSTSDLDKSTSNSLEKRYVVISIVILLMSSRRRTALGDIDYLAEWEESKEPEEPVKDEPTPPKSSPRTK